MAGSNDTAIPFSHTFLEGLFRLAFLRHFCVRIGKFLSVFLGFCLMVIINKSIRYVI